MTEDSEKNAGTHLKRGQLDHAFAARFPRRNADRNYAMPEQQWRGLAGLGSNIAVMLARSGIGKLLLVDFDVVDVTNLNRQMYFIPQLGKPKAEALPETVISDHSLIKAFTACHTHPGRQDVTTVSGIRTIILGEYLTDN